MLFALFRLLGNDTLQSHSQAGHPIVRLAHRPLPQTEVPTGGVQQRERAGGGSLSGGGRRATSL